jgi:hypothetical protein
MKILSEQSKSIESLLEPGASSLPTIRPQTHSFSRLDAPGSSKERTMYSRTTRASPQLLSNFPGLRQMLSALLERFVAAMRKQTTISELQEHLSCMWSWLEQLHEMLKEHLTSRPAQPDPSLSWEDLNSIYATQRWRPHFVEDPAVRTQRVLSPLCPNLPLTWLQRPPVQFVRDIVRHVHALTSMFDGVFQPPSLLQEGSADFEQGEQLKFCEQLIAFLNDQTVHPVLATADDLVAGKNPHLTNELLQARKHILNWNSRVHMHRSWGCWRCFCSARRGLCRKTSLLKIAVDPHPRLRRRSCDPPR